jgi:hypothetical protein
MRTVSLPLKSGDILFVSTPAYLYRKVAQATCSPASHVGIAFEDPRRGWVVAESAVPLSRYSPLRRFMRRTDRGWYAVRRLGRELTADEVAALRAACDRRMRLWYHTGFDYDSPRMFCSKFVHEVFREALGVEIGTVETFGELLQRNPQQNLEFWKLWFFGRIPWARRTVTPASQMLSPTLHTVIEGERTPLPGLGEN